MANAVTTEVESTCATGSTPIASLELFESPDSPRDLGPQLLEAETTIHVLDGVVYVVAEEHDWVLTPGDSATVPAGVPYRRWNGGDEAARWVEAYCTAA